jgi:hypothetical protein
MAFDGNDVADQSFETLLEQHRDVLQEELHTGLPGRIERVRQSPTRVDVTPMVRRRIPTRSGRLVSEAMPTIRAVPVVFPGSGQWSIRWPLAVGDEVLIFCCERDLSRWITTGDISDPCDVRAHHLAHAVAIPGLRSQRGALPAPTGSALELLHIGGSSIRLNEDGTIQLGGPATAQFVALANLVNAIVEAFLAGTPVAGDGGAALQTAVHLAWVAQGSTVAATKVKAE